MTQETAFGEATVTTLICVTKNDGARRYYRVLDDESNEELTREAFIAAGGEEPPEGSP